MAKSILQTEKKCYFSGAEYELDKHHIFGGVANRKLSEKYGLWVWLKHDIHMDLHDRDKDLEIRLKQDGQRAFEKKHSHEEFMKIFRKNYL